jgi:hypothetical protein
MSDWECNFKTTPRAVTATFHLARVGLRLLGLDDPLLSEQPAVRLGPPVLAKIERPLLTRQTSVKVDLGDDELTAGRDEGRFPKVSLGGRLSERHNDSLLLGHILGDDPALRVDDKASRN